MWHILWQQKCGKRCGKWLKCKCRTVQLQVWQVCHSDLFQKNKKMVRVRTTAEVCEHYGKNPSDRKFVSRQIAKGEVVKEL